MLVLKSLKQNADLGKAILSLLDNIDSSISQETISIILGVPKYKVCKELDKLENQKLVRRATVSKSVYWVKR